MRSSVRQLLRPARSIILPEYNPVSDLGSDCRMLWDARRVDLMTFGTVNRVSTWDDRVAAFRVSQGTDNARGKYLAGGFGGGVDCMDYDGIDDSHLGSAAPLLAALPTGATSWMAWSLWSQEDVVFNASRIPGGWGGNINQCVYLGKTAGGANHRLTGTVGSGAAPINVPAATNFTATGFSCLGKMVSCLSYTGTHIRLEANRTMHCETAATLGLVATRFGIGARYISASPGFFLLGKVVIYMVTNYLSDLKQAAVRNWLYGIMAQSGRY